VLELTIALALVLAPAPPPIPSAAADPGYYTYLVDPRATRLELRYRGSLGDVADAVARAGERLVFATNGGMYHEDRTPVGLFVDDGQERARLVSGASRGNFGWKPNGVFYLTRDGAAGVVTTERYAARPPAKVRWATQSGPSLLVDGVMHEGFLPDSRHVNVRNGVGVLPDGRVALVMSKGLVTFHALASHFAALGCKDALYLDGSVSRTYWPDGGVSQRGGDFGVIIAVIAPAR
jgi:uncharacterized protein YigE (DUF2233 family)